MRRSATASQLKFQSCGIHPGADLKRVKAVLPRETRGFTGLGPRNLSPKSRFRVGFFTFGSALLWLTKPPTS
jgi:hypothetical protein